MEPLPASTKGPCSPAETDALQFQSLQGCGSKSPIGRLDAGAGASNFKLSVISETPNGVIPNDRSPQRRQQQQQHHHHHQWQQEQQPRLAPHSTSASLTGKMMMSTGGSGGLDLRFAYTPLHDVRSGSAVATGLRGQGGAKTAAVLASTSSSSAPTAVGKACATTGDPADARRGTGAGARGAATSVDAVKSRPRPPPGDAGGWSASMQALCAMLRARRRDPALAGLVFLALTACIGEWAQACDAHATAGLPEQNEEKRCAAAPTTATARGWGWRACPPAATDMVVVARETAMLQSVPPRDKPPGAAAMFRRAPARFLPQHGGMLHGHLHGGGGAKGKDAGVEATATPRGKLYLGIREAIKAGLVWAEAVPLYRCRTTAEGLDGDGRGSSSIGGRDGAVGAAGEHAAAPSAADVSCSPVMAEAVGRLCRWVFLYFKLHKEHFVLLARGGGE